MIKNALTFNGRAVFLGLLTVALVIFAPIGHGWAQGTKLELITFMSGDLALKGFIWKPEGSGPFPAIVWNHGSEKLPGTVDSVAPYFVSRGYIFLVPHRRGQGRSPGAYIMDQLNAAISPEQRSRMLVALNEVHLQDQLAALAYLRSLPYVDQNRLVEPPSAGFRSCWPSKADPVIALPSIVPVPLRPGAGHRICAPV
jgi:hypothetical protein